MMFLFTMYLMELIVEVYLMSSFSRHLSIAAVALGATATLAAPLSEKEIAYLRAKKEIVFVSQPSHAPFEFVRKKQIAGMNVELAQWMAADMGFKIRFEVAPLGEAMELLRRGEADAMTSLFKTDRREDEFDFTRVIKLTPITLFTRGDNESIHSVADLEDRSVAIMGSGYALELLQERGVRARVRFTASMEECVKLVESGEVDAMIGNELVTRHHMYSTGEGDLKIVGDPLFTARLCMAVAEGDGQLLDLLNTGLAHALKSGTLNKIEAKWLGSEYARRGPSIQAVLLIAALAAAAVALMIGLILLWNRRLRRKVDERTAQYAESEERLRRIFENSPDAVFVLDREGHIISANTRACESVRIKKQTLLTKRVHDLTPAVFADEVDENMRLWFAGELEQCEGAALTSDGRVFPIEMTGTLQNIDGRELLQLHVRDITLRKEAEEKIHAAREMAEDAKLMAEKAREIAENASKAKSEFLANMSHEIRTPLNGIVGMAQLIADTKLTSEQVNCVETIQQSTAGLLQIINHVLDISKIEAGQMDVHESIIDPRDMCQNLLHIFKPQADQSGVTLKCECQDSVPLYVLGDEGLVEQILINLVGNALKFTHNGSVTLNIECSQKGAKGAELNFQVIDTGIGIDEAKQKTIFDKFIQADGSTKRLYGGTGLGLAICKQLVELMGGSIGLFSSRGQGSTFYFNLTLPQATHPATIKEPASAKIKTISKPNVRVLLVEDNLVNQKVATAILRKAGCVVDTADNGQDAIQRIRQETYDLVLMDCQMPVMDGFEATARIREMRPPLRDIPIIAITAHAMKDDKQKCIDGGMDDYIPKPVNRQALIDLINKHTSS